MKTKSITFILIMILVLLPLLSACRCEPSSETWYLFSYKNKMTFMGGIEMTLGHSDASLAYPFAGTMTEETGIKFYEDGRVDFVTWDGEHLLGTYTYEHVGQNYTTFTVTFENGETLSGESADYFGNKKLVFTFRETSYTFSTENEREGIGLDDIVARVHAGDIGYLAECEITKGEENYNVQFTEISSFTITKETAVYAIHIDADGNYEILDEIREGKAIASAKSESNMIVIYYVD